MRSVGALLTLALLFVLSGVHALKSYIKEVTREAGLDGTTENGRWAVIYYTKDCEPCTLLRIVVGDLLRDANGNEREIADADGVLKFAQVNCSDFPELCDRQQASELPTLRIYKDTQPVDGGFYGGLGLAYTYAKKLSVIEKKDDMQKKEDETPKKEDDTPKKEDDTQKKDTDTQEKELLLITPGRTNNDEKKVEYTEPKELTKSDFSESTADGIWVVVFYSPSCPACQKYKPIYKEMSKKYFADQELSQSGFNFALVDCSSSENREFCIEKEIYSFPTTRVYYNKEQVHVVTKALKDKQLGEFLLEADGKIEQIKTKDYLIYSQDSIEEQLKKDMHFVKFYSPYCSHCNILKPKWSSVAGKHGSILAKSGIYFGELDCVSNGDGCNKYGVTAYPTLNVYYKGKFIEEYKGDNEYPQLSEYASKLPELKARLDKEQSKAGDSAAEAKESAKPSEQIDHLFGYLSIEKVENEGKAVELNSENFLQYITHSTSVIGFYYGNCFRCTKLKTEMQKLSEMLKDEVNVGLVDCTVMQSVCSEFGVSSGLYVAHKEGIVPEIKIIWRDGKAVQTISTRLDAKDIMKHVEMLEVKNSVNKEIASKLKSGEQVPIKELNAAEFNEFVSSNTPVYVFVKKVKDEKTSDELDSRNELFLRLFEQVRRKTFIAHNSFIVKTDTADSELQKFIKEMKENDWSQDFEQMTSRYFNKNVTYADYLKSIGSVENLETKQLDGGVLSDRSYLVQFKDGQIFRYFGDENDYEKIIEWIAGESSNYLPKIDAYNSYGIFNKSKYLLLMLQPQNTILREDEKPRTWYPTNSAFSVLTKASMNVRDLGISKNKLNIRLGDRNPAKQALSTANNNGDMFLSFAYINEVEWGGYLHDVFGLRHVNINERSYPKFILVDSSNYEYYTFKMLDFIGEDEAENYNQIGEEYHFNSLYNIYGDDLLEILQPALDGFYIKGAVEKIAAMHSLEKAKEKSRQGQGRGQDQESSNYVESLGMLLKEVVDRYSVRYPDDGKLDSIIVKIHFAMYSNMNRFKLLNNPMESTKDTPKEKGKEKEKEKAQIAIKVPIAQPENQPKFNNQLKDGLDSSISGGYGGYSGFAILSMVLVLVVVLYVLSSCFCRRGFLLHRGRNGARHFIKTVLPFSSADYDRLESNNHNSNSERKYQV